MAAAATLPASSTMTIALAGVPILVCTAAHPMRQAEIGAWAPVVSKPFDVAQVEAFLAAADRRQSGSDRHGRQAG